MCFHQISLKFCSGSLQRQTACIFVQKEIPWRGNIALQGFRILEGISLPSNLLRALLWKSPIARSNQDSPGRTLRGLRGENKDEDYEDEDDNQEENEDENEDYEDGDENENEEEEERCYDEDVSDAKWASNTEGNFSSARTSLTRQLFSA